MQVRLNSHPMSTNSTDSQTASPQSLESLRYLLDNALINLGLSVKGRFSYTRHGSAVEATEQKFVVLPRVRYKLRHCTIGSEWDPYAIRLLSEYLCFLRGDTNQHLELRHLLPSCLTPRTEIRRGANAPAVEVGREGFNVRGTILYNTASLFNWASVDTPGQ